MRRQPYGRGNRSAVALLLILLADCTSGGSGKSGTGGASAGGGTSGSGGTLSAGGVSGGGVSGSSGASDGGGTTDGSLDLVDPVKSSEGDTTLQGVDTDNDGIRDDVKAYILTLEADPRKQTALVSFARESTAMMVLGGTTGTTKPVAVAQAQRVGKTIDCLHDLYTPDLTTKKAILQDVRNALYDNALRLRAYNHASTLVSGAIFHGGHGCDSAITGVSQ